MEKNERRRRKGKEGKYVQKDKTQARRPMAGLLSYKRDRSEMKVEGSVR